MNNFVLWFFGVSFGLSVSIGIISVIDRDYTAAISRLDRVMKTCEIANSTPVSFDTTEVTCKNGAVMQIINKE